MMATTFGLLGPILADVSADSWAGLGQGFLSLLSLLVSLVGCAGIVWGAYAALVRQLSMEAAVAEPSSRSDVPSGRPIFFSYLLGGLEFLIAGCLIKTLAVPDWQQASVLASLVVARTLLGLCAKWEGTLGISLAASAAVASLTAESSTNHPAAIPEVPEDADLAAATMPRVSICTGTTNRVVS